MAIEKKWKVVDGVVGTVHINRSGIEVDFRSGDALIESDKVTIWPSKGQDLKPVLAPIVRRNTLTSIISEDSNDRQHSGCEEVFIIFLGEELRFERSFYREYISEEALEAARAESDEKWRLHIEKREAFKGKLAVLTPTDLFPLLNLTRTRLARLERVRITEDEVAQAVKCHFNASDVYDWQKHLPVCRQIADGFNEFILREQAEQRARRKEEWLAKHSLHDSR